MGCVRPSAEGSSQLPEFALSSALNDRRFKPITLGDLPSLRVGVSLLVDYETCSNCYDWVVGTHGIFLEFFDASGGYFSGTFLPEIAPQQFWSVEATVENLIRKAHYQGVISKDLLNRMRVQRFQSSQCWLTYDEWRSMIN